jgi:dihydroflavonol-4-reductase
MAGARQRHLVTGGTGLLGRALIARLMRRGDEVVVLSRSNPAAARSRGARWIRGSVLDPTALAIAADGVDGVFHLAGRVLHSRREGYAGLRELHVGGSLLAVEAAAHAGARRIVLASTSGTVAVCRRECAPIDDTAPYATETVRRWPYYLTKIEAERAARFRARALGIDIVCLRPSLLLGPGDLDGVSNRAIVDFLRGRVPFVPPGGMSFVDVRDTADAFVAAMHVDDPDPAYLLAADNVSFAGLFERLAGLTGRPAPRCRLPLPAARAAATALALQARLGAQPVPDPVLVEMATHFWYADTESAWQRLGVTPRDPDETLRDAVAWAAVAP